MVPPKNCKTPSILDNSGYKAPWEPINESFSDTPQKVTALLISGLDGPPGDFKGAQAHSPDSTSRTRAE